MLFWRPFCFQASVDSPAVDHLPLKFTRIMCDAGCALLLSYSIQVLPPLSIPAVNDGDTSILTNTTYYVLPNTFTQVGSVGIVQASPSVATDPTTSLLGSELPTTILTDANSVGASTTEPEFTARSTMSGSGIPSTLPGVIGNPYTNGTLPAQPDDTTATQFAFKQALDYEFVVTHQSAIDEIFLYLPIGIGNALNESTETIIMQSLVPYDTRSGYITTLALSYIPSASASNMQEQLSTESSRFHNYSPNTSPVF